MDSNEEDINITATPTKFNAAVHIIRPRQNSASHSPQDLSPASTNKIKLTKLVLKEPTRKAPKSPGKSKFVTVNNIPTSPVSYTKSILNAVTSDLNSSRNSEKSTKLDDAQKHLEEKQEFIAISSEFNDYLTETMRREEEKYERRLSLAEELAMVEAEKDNKSKQSAITVGFDDDSNSGKFEQENVNLEEPEEEKDEFLEQLEADLKRFGIGKYEKKNSEESTKSPVKSVEKSPEKSKNQNLDKTNKTLAKSDPVIFRPESAVTFKTSGGSPETKTSRKTSAGSWNSAKTLEMSRKDKPYDPEAAREFMKKQKEKRKTETSKSSSAYEKDVIKQRLDELKRNTRNIVSRNVNKAKSKSANNTPKKEKIVQKTKAVVPQEVPVPKVITKPQKKPEPAKQSIQFKSQDVSSETGKTGILKKPTEEVKTKPSQPSHGTPITENHLKINVDPTHSNESVNRHSKSSSRAESFTPTMANVRMETRIAPQSSQNLPFWLRNSAVRPYPYNFIWAVRKKLEALTAETQLQEQQQQPSQKTKKVQIQTHKEVKIIETPKTSTNQKTLRKPLVQSMDQADGKKNRFSDFLMNKYINNPAETSKIDFKRPENDSETNAHTSSFQDLEGNTISEISSIRSDAVNPLSSTQIKAKEDDTLKDDDGDTSINEIDESILHSSVEVSPIKKNNERQAEDDNEDRLYITLHRGDLTTGNRYSENFDHRSSGNFSDNNSDKRNNFLTSTKVSWDDIQMRGPSKPEMSGKSPLTQSNVQQTSKFSMNSEEAKKYKQNFDNFSRTSKSTLDDYKYSDDFQKTSQDSRNSTIESVNTVMSSKYSAEKTTEESHQTSADSQKTVTEESIKRGSSDSFEDVFKKPLQPRAQGAFKKPLNNDSSKPLNNQAVESTSKSSLELPRRIKNLSTIEEIQDENKENQDKNKVLEKEVEYQKMLDAFNQSLSHVIEVNQMLYTALSEKSSSTKNSSSSRYQHSIASSRSMISSYNPDVSSAKSNNIPGSQYSSNFETENTGKEVKASESKTLTPSNKKSSASQKSNKKEDTISNASSIKTLISEGENEKSFVVKYSDNSGVLKNFHENNLNMLKEQQQNNLSGGQERKEFSSATITTKTTTTTTKIHHQNIVNEDRDAGDESDVLAMLNYTDTEFSFNMTDLNCSYSSLGMIDQMIKNETNKSDVLTMQIKTREKVLIDRTKGQIAWLELQKQKYKKKGMMEKISEIKKKQRAILVRLEKERSDIKKMSVDQQNVNQNNSNRSLTEKFNASLNLKKTMTPKIVEKTVMEPVRGFDMNAGDSIERILQKREEELKERRNHVENLMRWHQKLDQEERDIIEMEKMLLGYNFQNVHDKENIVIDEIDNLNLIKRRRSITSGKESEKERKSFESSQSAQKSRKLKKIEKSLKLLQNISNTSINTEEDEADEYVDISGSDLNKLWQRLTGHRAEKFEQTKNFHWNKGDLEKLYEEAKRVVLEDFDETSKFKRLFESETPKKKTTPEKVETDFSTMNSIENIATEEDSGAEKQELQEVQEEGESKASYEVTPNVYGGQIKVFMKPQENREEAVKIPDPVVEEILKPVQTTDLDESLEGIQTIESQKMIDSPKTSEDEYQIFKETPKISEEILNFKESFESTNFKKFESQKSESSIPESLENLTQKSDKSFLESVESDTLKSQEYFAQKSEEKAGSSFEKLQDSPQKSSGSSIQKILDITPKSSESNILKIQESPPKSLESSLSKEDITKTQKYKSDVTSLFKIYDVSEIYKQNETKSDQSEEQKFEIQEDFGKLDRSGSISTEISFNSESIQELEEDFKDLNKTEQIEDISFPNFESTMNDTQLEVVEEEGLNFKDSIVQDTVDIVQNDGDSDDNSNSERRNSELEKRLISINDSLEELSEIFEKAPIRQASKSASESPDFSSSSTLTYSTDKDFKDEGKDQKKLVSLMKDDFLEPTKPQKLLHLRKSEELELPEKIVKTTPEKTVILQEPEKEETENLEKSPRSWSENSGLSRITERTEKSESSGEFDGPSVEIPAILTQDELDLRKKSPEFDTSGSGSEKAEENLKSPETEDSLKSPVLKSSEFDDSERLLKSEASPNSEPSRISKESEKTPEHSKSSPEKSEISEDLEILESIDSDLSDLKSQESSESRKEFVKFINASIAKTLSPVHNESSSPGASPKIPNAAMPDIISEAEVLRRQQLVIEQEIKQLEQQVPYIFKLPPPYIPPAKDSPLSLLIPSDDRINEIVNDKLDELSGGEMPKSLETTNIYERIIIDMCREFHEEFKEPQEQQLSYMKDSNYKNLVFYSSKDRRKCLQEYILKKIQRILIIPTKVNQQQLQQSSQIFPMSQMPLSMGAQFRPLHFYLNNINYCNSKRKRDNVDEILIHELVEDESKWLYFDKEESEIKNNLTSEIFDAILSEAIDDMQEAYLKKYGLENATSANDSGAASDDKNNENLE